MTLKQKLSLAWKNRSQIAEGFFNTVIGCKPELEAEAQRRKAICESNVCGYYDKDGKPETSVVPGKPACSQCTCNIELKVHSFSSHCSLKEAGREPLWEELWDDEVEKHLRDESYKQQKPL